MNSIDDLDMDEVDLALIALVEMGEDIGVAPSQMLRLIRDRVELASELADMAAEYAAFDEMPKSFLFH